MMDGGEQPLLESLVVDADRRLERADHVADDVFGRIMEQAGEPPAAFETRRLPTGDVLDEEAVLGDREGMVALGLAVPAGDARQAVGDVLDLDVERRGAEKVEPPPRQHPLPRPRRNLAAAAHERRGVPCSAQAVCRWQVTRWSFTIPTACMKA